MFIARRCHLIILFHVVSFHAVPERPGKAWLLRVWEPIYPTSLSGRNRKMWGQKGHRNCFSFHLTFQVPWKMVINWKYLKDLSPPVWLHDRFTTCHSMYTCLHVYMKTYMYTYRHTYIPHRTTPRHAIPQHTIPYLHTVTTYPTYIAYPHTVHTIPSYIPYIHTYIPCHTTA